MGGSLPTAGRTRRAAADGCGRLIARRGTPCRGCMLLLIAGDTHDSPDLSPRHRLGAHLCYHTLQVVGTGEVAARMAVPERASIRIALDLLRGRHQVRGIGGLARGYSADAEREQRCAVVAAPLKVAFPPILVVATL